MGPWLILIMAATTLVKPLQLVPMLMLTPKIAVQQEAIQRLPLVAIRMLNYQVLP